MSQSRGNAPRGLSADEAAAWERLARKITPLKQADGSMQSALRRKAADRGLAERTNLSSGAPSEAPNSAFNSASRIASGGALGGAPNSAPNPNSAEEAQARHASFSDSDRRKDQDQSAVLQPDFATLLAQGVGGKTSGKPDRNTIEGTVARGKPPAASQAKQSAAPGHGLDSHWERRLKNGAIEPDFTLDLHGAMLDSAYARLESDLTQARAMGARVVLVIAGRSRPTAAADRGSKRGAIRAKILDWLAAGPHSADIAAIRGAHRRHGGAGALYLVFRRRR